MRFPFTTPPSPYAGVTDPSLFCAPLSSIAESAGSDSHARRGDRDIARQGLELETLGRVGGRETPGMRRQREEVSEVREEKGGVGFDYVICGGGTAGCVLASRLSEDPTVKVLLVEAGESDQKELMSRIPAGFGNLFKTHLDWDYLSVPQPHLNNRSLYQPRGKMLGGCSAMNAQVYQRCAPADYDEWSSSAAPGWAWKDLEPYFEKAEGLVPNPEYAIDEAKRNTKGPFVTGYPHTTNEVTKAFVETGPAVGLPKNPDLNVETHLSGITRFQTTATSSGVRSSASAAYLPPSVFQSRKNLEILTGTISTRIIFDEAHDESGNKNIVGIEVALANPKNDTDNAKRWIARARSDPDEGRKGTYILSLGAFATPQLLLSSGIGPLPTLEAAGVEQVVDLEGVGEGVKDHFGVTVAFTVGRGESWEWLKSPVKSLPSLLRWLAFGTGPLSSNIAEAAGFFWVEDLKEDWSLKVGTETGDGDGKGKEGSVKKKRKGPDGEVVAAPLYYVNHARAIPPSDTETQDFFTLGAIVLKPHSTGSVKIKSGDMREKPVIDPNFLGDQRDEEVILKTLHLIRRLSQTPPLSDHILSVASPRLSLDEWAKLDDGKLMGYARSVGETVYHPMCSAKMAPRNQGGVVSPESLKVYGCSNLRVCDASVFPLPVGGHPQAAVVAVAEKFADMLKAERATQAGTEAEFEATRFSG
ncbi:hypothetical protein JCM11251_001807 [Rhodosporidiobolus azoricus]